jgi:predicted ATPase
MIHKITIENFSSIAERQEIDFTINKKVPALPCFQPSRANPAIRLPTTVGFYGANASGKSTILRAVWQAAQFVCHSVKLAPTDNIPFFQPHMEASWAKKPTIIIVEFDGQLAPLSQQIEPQYLFRYELHIALASTSHNQKIASSVAYEALSYRPKTKLQVLFQREAQEFHFHKDFDIAPDDSRLQAVTSNRSILSTLAHFNHPLSMNLCALIGGLISNLDGFDKSSVPTQNLLTHYKNNPIYHQRLNEVLSRIDVGLHEMTIHEGPSGLYANFSHDGLTAPIFWHEESAGTRKFIEIFAKLHWALDTGGVVLIDEIDNDLHPALLCEIVGWFHDPERNKHKAQLLFTAHNPALLNDLEKEQVFFTTKANGKTTVYAASAIQGLRREPQLMKKYLNGTLGAVPLIG